MRKFLTTIAALAGIQVPDATANNEAASWGQVQTLVSNSVSAAQAGLDLKASVRAATTANVTLSGTQTVDDVVLSAGDRVLVKNQATASENGIYVVAVGAWVRATDADANAEVTTGLFVMVEEGATLAKSQWKLTTTGSIVVGATALTFEKWGMGLDYVAGTGVAISGESIAIDTTTVPRKVAATIGNGTNTSFSVVHNLGTKDVLVSIRDTSTDELVLADVVASDANTVTLNFANAPAANAYRAVIHA